MNRRARPAVVLVVLLVGVGTAAALRGGDDSHPPVVAVAAATPTPAPSPSSTLGEGAEAGALVALAALVVAEPAHADTYERAAFGAAWTDTDRNGCDTRNDVLRRDLTDVVLKDGTHGCVVLSGTLHDPYTGKTLSFVRGAGDDIQIDHVVALADAWRTGASAWPYAKLVAFANDPVELLAVDGPANTAKSDSDAAGWLPTTDTCAYAARQVAVKAKYGLLVTPAEGEALRSVLADCPDEPLPTSALPTLAPNRSPAPRPEATRSPAAPQGFVGSQPQTGGGAGLDPDYGTCANARAHGAGPYYAGKDPEYEWYQDRDHDGMVCE